MYSPKIQGREHDHLLDPFKIAPLFGLRLVDVDDACEHLPKAMLQQLLVHRKSQWSGGIYAQPLPDGSRICILNSRHNSRRTKITLMEEVAHIYLKHSPTGLMRSADGLRMRGYDKNQEQDAYGVGAAALLPWRAIFPAVNKGMAIDELAEKFEVSSELIATALTSQELIPSTKPDNGPADSSRI